MKIATEGQLRLVELILRGRTQQAIADDIGAGQPTVAHWLSGRKKPDYRGRKAALEVLGIGLDAWDTPLAAPFEVRLQRGGGGGVVEGAELIEAALRALRAG